MSRCTVISAKKTVIELYFVKICSVTFKNNQISSDKVELEINIASYWLMSSIIIKSFKRKMKILI